MKAPTSCSVSEPDADRRRTRRCGRRSCHQRKRPSLFEVQVFVGIQERVRSTNLHYSYRIFANFSRILSFLYSQFDATPSRRLWHQTGRRTLAQPRTIHLRSYFGSISFESQTRLWTHPWNQKSDNSLFLFAISLVFSTRSWRPFCLYPRMILSLFSDSNRSMGGREPPP